MALDAGDVNVKFTADTSDLSKRLDEMKTKLKELGDAPKASVDAFEALGQVLVGFLQKLAIAETIRRVVSTLTDWEMQTSRTAQEMGQLSQRTGVAAESLVGMSIALAEVGLTTEAFATGIQQMSRHLETARTTASTTATAFEKMGIDVRDAMSQEDLMRKVADHFAAMEDGASKTALAMDLFGRSGAQLIPILNQGSKGLDEAKRKAEEMGLVLSKVQQNDLQQFGDKVTDLGKGFEGFKTQMSLLMLPAFEKLADIATKALAPVVAIIKALNDGESVVTKFATVFMNAGSAGAPSLAAGAAPPPVPGSTKTLDLGGQIPESVLANLGEEKKYTSVADAQEAAGKRIVASTQLVLQVMKELHTSYEVAESLAKGANEADVEGIVARARAQQTLGKDELQIIASETKERNEQFGMYVEQNMEKIAIAEEAGVVYLETEGQLKKINQELQGQIVNQTAAGQAIVAAAQARLGYEATEEDILGIQQSQEKQLVSENEKGQLILTKALLLLKADEEYKARVEDANKALLERGAAMKGLVEIQQNLGKAQLYNDTTGKDITIAGIQREMDARMQLQTLITTTAELEFQNDADVIKSNENVLAEKLRGIALEEENRRAALSRQSLSDKQRATEETKIDQDIMNKKMALQSQYTSFAVGQLQQLVQGNAFSLAQISNQFTSATAQWIVTGKGFQNFWQQMQISLVQMALNTLVQWLAKKAITLLQMEGMDEAATIAFGETEAAKTEIAVVEEEARALLNKATMDTILGGMFANLAGITSVGEAMVAIMSATTEMAAATLLAVGAALSSNPITAALGLEADAAAAALSIEGAAAGAVGSAAIAGAATTAGETLSAAIAANSIPALAGGGIVSSPTLALVGEAGPEAVVPLNQYNSGKSQTIIVELDGRAITRFVTDDFIALLRLKGVPA